LVSHSDPLLIVRGEFERDVQHPDLGFIQSGTISYEYFWFDRWYNIFRFHEPDGSLRNFYCNIALPPSFQDSILDYVDLDIDIVVWPDTQITVLDEAEFETNASLFGYPGSVRKAALQSLDDLLKMIGDRGFPFSEGLSSSF
jgi:protein associated with RNAse G/E